MSARRHPPRHRPATLSAAAAPALGPPTEDDGVGVGTAPTTREGIDLAYQQISRRWRDVPRRRGLITELTALDWQARTLHEGEPADEELIGRISILRSQIWLSSET